MVDITVEILGSSVLTRNGFKVRYRIKTWWTHIDVPPDITSIKLPRLPVIQPYLIMTGKDTTVFIETWEDWEEKHGEDSRGKRSPRNNSRFLGITTCSVDEQLKNTNLNPSVQWLTVHDPIENTQRGKLLLKVDAKFAFPSNDNNKDEEIPVKMDNQNHPNAQPYSNGLLRPDLYGYNDSPSKHSMLSRISRKSDTSMFSNGSASSSRSNDQGVQTDLSLAVLPDIAKYTSALKSFSISQDSRRSGGSPMERHRLSKQSSKSLSDADAPIVDPLQLAQNLLLKGNSSVYHNRRNSDSSSAGQPCTSSSAFRRTCLVKQHQQQQGLFTPPNTTKSEGRSRSGSGNTTGCYNVESIEDVIDMLNHGSDSAFSTPDTVISRQNGMNRRGSSDSQSEHNLKPHLLPNYSKQDSNNNGAFDANIRRLAPDGSSAFDKERSSSPGSLGGGSVSQPGRGTTGTRSSGANFDYNHGSDGRFREIHFDGIEAKQQATIRIMAKPAQSSSQSVSAKPPIMKRRIAAAIFND